MKGELICPKEEVRDAKGEQLHREIERIAHKVETPPFNRKNTLFSVYIQKIECHEKMNYIFSGAFTPISFRAFANVVFTAVINANRASVSSLLSWFNTFSAL